MAGFDDRPPGEVPAVGLGVSILLIAVGAILVWGVTADAEGLNVDAIGVILIIVGLIGLVISAIFWSSWGGFGGYRRRTAYVDDAGTRPVYPAGGRRVDVVDEEVRDAGGPPPGPPPP